MSEQTRSSAVDIPRMAQPGSGSGQCPVCNSFDSTLYLDGEDTIAPESVGSSRSKLSHGRILKCRNCGLCFRSFRPNPAQLADLYRAADDQVYEAETANRVKTAERHRRRISRYVRPPGTILDIGSASGAFLRLMMDAGWKAYGVEPSSSQCEKARRVLGTGAVIQECVLEHAVLPGNFDVITLWDVLEHVTEPVVFLRRCSDLLRPGGYLFLNTPRIDSAVARALGARWPLLLAEHLNYFTAESLQMCAEKSKLTLVATGQRPVSFSIGYILRRLSQHDFPLIGAASRLAKFFHAEPLAIPIWMGEVFAVMRKPDT
jgi:2-polyprenyl-3-methyl-5-hydroxy-6-metoxy-1,4-benzoquinol methylase